MPDIVVVNSGCRLEKTGNLTPWHLAPTLLSRQQESVEFTVLVLQYVHNPSMLS